MKSAAIPALFLPRRSDPGKRKIPWNPPQDQRISPAVLLPLSTTRSDPGGRETQWYQPHAERHSHGDSHPPPENTDATGSRRSHPHPLP